MSNVPCNGCTECCRGFDTVWLMPDEIGRYRMEVEAHSGRYMLARSADGDCVYLGDTGCTIHSTRPHVCRWYDCRTAVPPAIPFGRVRAALVEAMERCLERSATAEPA